MQFTCSRKTACPRAAPISIAAPGKGRLSVPAKSLLEQAGFALPDCERAYSACSERYSTILARARDIPYYVANNFADFGITGRDLVYESGLEVYEVGELQFGECAVVLASDGRFDSWRKLAGARVATQYPNLARNYLDSRGVRAEIIRLDGATELAVAAGIADAVVDIASTGRTLLENGLCVKDVVIRSKAVLIASKESLPKADAIRKLLKIGGGGK